MRKFLICLISAISALASAQGTTVTFTTLLDTTQPGTEITNGGTYVPSADKYASVHATKIRIYSNTGIYENDLSLTGISPTGTVGFNAITATRDGILYAVEDGSKDLWRWDSVTDTTPDKVYDTTRKYWCGYTSTVGNDIIIGFSDEATSGPATFFRDTMPVSSGSFSFEESAPIESKMSLAFNANATSAWTVADTDKYQPLQKFNKVAGNWEMDTVWQPPTMFGTYSSGGPTAYDETNNLVFQLSMHPGSANLLRVYDGTTGAVLGSQTLVNGTLTQVRGGGAWVVPTGATGGTLWVGARGPGTTAGTSQFNMYKWTYSIERDSSIADWALFEE